MNTIDAAKLVSQMRELAAQAAKSPLPAAHAGGAQAPDFASVLSAAINGVNAQQVKASDLATAFDSGAPGVDLTQVMIESQKAAVSFRAMTEVRNKLVAAYQDIMNMPL
jgi:flagellar hook-basal body complex protein FliE